VPFSDERVGLFAARRVERVVRLRAGTRFVERVVAPAIVELPVERGERVGEVVVTTAEGRVVARSALVAARAVAAPGLGERLGWYAGRALDEAGDMVGTVLPGLG
jgi:hypothetical protein